MTNKYIGSTFESFLEEEGMLEQVETVALERVIAYELQKTMEKNLSSEH